MFAGSLEVAGKHQHLRVVARCCERLPVDASSFQLRLEPSPRFYGVSRDVIMWENPSISSSMVVSPGKLRGFSIAIP